MNNFIVGAQIYSVRRFTQNANDLSFAMKALKSMGYNTIQLSGQSRDIPDDVIAELLQENGLKCVVTHNGIDDFESGLSALIARHKKWSCCYAGLGAMPEEYRTSAKGFRDFAHRVNEAGKKLKDEGIVFVYHNHAFEFARFDGVLGMDILFDEFGDNVQFELDSYWVQAGGCDPVKWFKKVDGRMDVAHFKDMVGKENTGSVQTMVPIGSGNMNFLALKQVCEETHVKYAEVEQDNASDMADPLGQMKMSADYLKKMGFYL